MIGTSGSVETRPSLAWEARQPRGLPGLSAVGRTLFLAGIFVMVTGDWPGFTLLTHRWFVPLPWLGWPWLYPALLAASFVVLMSSGTLRMTRPTVTNVLHIPIALLPAAFLLSVVFSQIPSLSWWAFGGFLAIVGFSLAVARIVEDEACVAGLSLVIPAAALCLAVRVIAWRLDEGLDNAAYHVRNNAWLGKIQIAWVLNLVAPLLLARLIQARAIGTALLYGAAWLASGAAVYLLFSKAGAFAFALTTLTLCALNPRYWRRWSILLGGFLSLALVLIVRSPTMSTSLVAGLLRSHQDAGIVMRQDVWRQTARMIRDHPVTGIGLGTYDDVAITRYGPPADPAFFRLGWHAHNMFLHVLAETGSVGFLAWCYLWFTIVRFLLRRWREGDTVDRLDTTAAFCFLLAFFVLSMTEAMLAARVTASLRMNLTLALLVFYGLRLAPGPTASRPLRQ